MSGLLWRRGTRVTVAALVVALGLTASGSAASTGTAGAQAPARSGSSTSLTSGNATTTALGTLDGSVAAAAQPPISDVGYDTCANIAANPPPHLAGPFAASAQVAGWADAAKLGGSLPLGSPVTGLAESEGSTEGYYTAAGVAGTDGQYQCAEALLQLDYAGQREFPPVTVTFLEYGSVPVTATANFVQDGTEPLKAVLYELVTNNAGVVVSNSAYATIVTTAQVSLRVAQVKVNGVTLDVGGNCQTSGPVYTPDPVLDPGNNQLILSAGNTPGEPEPREQSILAGGAQAGLATVPPFAGCVTPSGENLDALLDSSLSGQGNYVSVVQGPLCAQNLAAANCAAPTAYNQPLYAPLWTVSHGGPYSATGTLTITQKVGTVTITFTCADSAVSGDLPDAAGPPRGPVGTFRWPSTLDCTSTAPGVTASSYTITQEGTATLGADLYTAATQTTKGTADDFTLDVQGPGGCTAQLTGAEGMSYASGTGLLTVAANGTGVAVTNGAALVTVRSTCDQLPPPSSTNSFRPTVSATYQLGSGTVITSP